MPANPPPISPQFLTARSIWPRRHEFHVVTYAEEGFAPLNIHAEGTGVEKEELVAFADEVNCRNETGSLFPRAACFGAHRTRRNSAITLRASWRPVKPLSERPRFCSISVRRTCRRS